jgi:resuscitation-promoting factor RpfB
MRRLAVLVFIAGIALAQLGIEQFTSGASGSAVERQRVTSLDHARASLPLPRTVAVAPVDESRLRATRQATATAAARQPSRRRPVGPAVWARLAACESGGNPQARSASGLYYGAFQFSLATWHSLGYEGNPVDHSYTTQLEAAQRLQARSGWGQWPRCSRRLGLR